MICIKWRYDDDEGKDNSKDTNKVVIFGLTWNSSEKSALTAWSKRFPQSPSPFLSLLLVRHGFMNMAWHQLAT